MVEVLGFKMVQGLGFSVVGSDGFAVGFSCEASKAFRGVFYACRV